MPIRLPVKLSTVNYLIQPKEQTTTTMTVLQLMTGPRVKHQRFLSTTRMRLEQTTPFSFTNYDEKLSISGFTLFGSAYFCCYCQNIFVCSVFPGRFNFGKYN